MIKPFKFLRNPLLISHDGHEINVGEYFYTVNKEDIILPGKITPKYTMVTRCIHPIYKDKFKPDHDLLWYFKSKSNAEWLINVWKRQDDGIEFHRQAEITLTFRR